MDKLENIKKENNFSVPKNYFEYLPSEITDRIHSKPRQGKIFILKPVVAFSSAAILIAAIVLYLFLHKTDNRPLEMILSENEIQDIIDNPESYNIDELAVTETILNSTISADSLSASLNIPEDEIKSYLEETTNANNIINNL